MTRQKKTLWLSTMTFTFAFLFLPSLGLAQPADVPVPLPPQARPANEAPNVTRAVDCDAGQTIQEAVDNSNTGDTILVSGTCNEHVAVGSGKTSITLDGQGTATINGPDPAANTVRVSGSNVTIRGFVITGGNAGVSLAGGFARIDSNTIQ